MLPFLELEVGHAYPCWCLPAQGILWFYAPDTKVTYPLNQSEAGSALLCIFLNTFA